MRAARERVIILMALTAVYHAVRVMTKSSRYAQQIIITRQGP